MKPLDERVRALMRQLREGASRFRARAWAERRTWLPLALAGLVAGVLASLTATVVMGALRLWWGTPTPPELLGDIILPRLTASQFVNLLIQYRPNSKTGPLGQALLAQSALGVALGLAFALLVLRDPRNGWRPDRRAVVASAILALAMTALAVGLFWPVLPGGLVGYPVGVARLQMILALLLTFGSYATVLLLANGLLRHVWADGPARVVPTEASATEPARTGATASALSTLRRREALVAGGAVVLYVGAGGLAIRDLLGSYLARSTISYDGMGAPSPTGNPITPTDEFYVVTQNVLDPMVVTDHWRLEIGGLVRQSHSWTYAETLRLPSETRAITLECISNEVGGHLLSTANWRGISLERLLALADGAESSGRYVVFTGVDGYQTSLPLADLLQARTLLAWEMNGEPLPMRHGFPLRAIVPGRYGEQSAKWLTRVDVVDHPFKGLYQSQGWSDKQLSTLSRIDAPGGQIPQGTVTVAGVAFAGIRGIQRVELSADHGATWNNATLQPPISDQSWVLWTWQWTPSTAGRYTLVVRATDGTGALQTSTQRGTVPDGATGWHSVQVEVR